MGPARRSALAAHRRRQKKRGFVRVEVQVPRDDADLVRAVAGELQAGNAARLRVHLARALGPRTGGSILDMIACDLPDDAFAPMLERDRRSRELDEL